MAMQIQANASQVASLQDWFGKMSDAKGTALPMDKFAQSMFDGFEKLGVKHASQIDAGTVSALGKALGVSADQLQKATQKCPFSHGLPKLD